MSRLSYVVRVPSGVYYFRRVIPPALRPLMPEPWRGKSVWKVSGTYRGKLLQWEGRSPNVAAARWRDHAHISTL